MLAQLHERGALTEKEFASEKARLLAAPSISLGDPLLVSTATPGPVRAAEPVSKPRRADGWDKAFMVLGIIGVPCALITLLFVPPLGLFMLAFCAWCIWDGVR